MVKIERCGLIGLGTVGKAFYKALNINKLVPGVRITRILVKDGSKRRRLDADDGVIALNEGVVTTDPVEALESPEIDIVVDASNEPSPELIERALKAGKPAITVNKRLMACYGDRLVHVALKHEQFLLFGGTAFGKIPVFLNLALYHCTLGIHQLAGICNGTANFILSALADGSETYNQALTQAQELGYAEADPTLDVQGWDSLHKLKLLAACAWGYPLLSEEVDAQIYRDGITGIEPSTFVFARALGYKIRLVGTAELVNGRGLALRVMPGFVAGASFLGGVSGVENGLIISDLIGPPTELQGPGAGGEATAAAMIGDLKTAIDCMLERRLPLEFQRLAIGKPVDLAPIEEIEVRPVFQSSTQLHRCGALCEKLRVVAGEGLDVEQIYSVSRSSAGTTPDLIACFRAPLAQVISAAKQLRKLDSGSGNVKVLEVLGDDALDF